MTCNWCQSILHANEPTVAVNQKVFHEACIAMWRLYWKEVILANVRLVSRRLDS
jgi:hypothetical protein